MRRLVTNLFCVFFVSSGLVSAQERSVVVHEKVKFLVHVDIKTFRNTPFGARVFRMAQAEAIKEINDEFGNEDEAKEGLARVQEALGFDPFRDLDAVTVMGSSFKRPEESVQVVLQLRKTTGNLEGLMVGLPDYASTTHGKHEIHSARVDGAKPVYGAIHTDRAGTKRVVAATSKDSVISLLTMLNGKGEGRRVRLSGSGSTFVHVELLELPFEEIGEGPQQNFARMLKNIAVRIAGDDDGLRVKVSLTTRDEKRTEQLRQAVQGLVAMASFIQDDDEDVRRAQELLKHLSIERDGNRLDVNLVVPPKQLDEFLKEAMDEL